MSAVRSELESLPVLGEGGARVARCIMGRGQQHPRFGIVRLDLDCSVESADCRGPISDPQGLTPDELRARALLSKTLETIQHGVREREPAGSGPCLVLSRGQLVAEL